MNTVWTDHQQHAQYLGIDLDQDVCSEPGSVPLPNEDFEPFLTDYAVYDERLQSTLNRVQTLSIPENDQYSIYEPSSDVPFTITRSMKPSYDYFDAEPEPEHAWSSPRKNAPVPEMWSSPTKARHHPALNIHVGLNPHNMSSSPVKSQTPMMHHSGPSPEFFSPRTPAFPSNRQLFSPSHAPPMVDLPSSPPESPSLPPTYRPAPSLVGMDSLGITDTASQIDHIKQEHQEQLDLPSSEEALQWEPVLTIPVEVHRESDRIIRSQRSMSELKTKRKSCLPPGTVDEYIAGTEDGSYRCLYPHCGRLFRRKYNLKSHIQTHLCDRPYICDHCDASFVRPHDLKRHELCHQTTRQFVCPCGKGFTRMDAMQRHRARMICDGGSVSPKKSPRKRAGRTVGSPSDSASSSEGDSTPTLA